MMKIASRICAALVALLLIMPLGVMASESAADEQMKKEICDAWLAHKGESLRWGGVAQYYGIVSGKGVFLYQLPTTAGTALKVAGYHFQFSGGCIVYVYGNGTFYTLQEAFDAQVVTADDVGVIYEIYSGNPVTGDASLLPVLILSISAAALLGVTYRRKRESA